MSLEVNKFIVCDDIRQEINKKYIFIGMYSRNLVMLNKNVPFILPSLAFYFEGTQDHPLGEITIKVINPDNKDIGSMTTAKPPVDKLDNRHPSNFIISMNANSFPVYTFGDYTLKLSDNHGGSVEVGFKIVLQRDEDDPIVVCND